MRNTYLIPVLSFLTSILLTIEKNVLTFLDLGI